MTEYRASFDADIAFSNGGGLQAHGFRLDIANEAIADDELAALFVRHLGLLMVQRVRLSNIEVVAEPHKGSRGGPSEPGAIGTRSRLVELNHVIEAGMTTCPGLPAPFIKPYLTYAASRDVYAPGTE